MPPVISCLTSSFGPFGAEGAAAHILETGLSALTLTIPTAGQAGRFGGDPIDTDSTLADLNRVACHLEAYAVSVVSCVTPWGPLCSPETIPLAKRKIDLASHFGVTQVVGTAGPVFNEADRERLIDHARRIGDYASSRGQIVCLETGRGVTATARDMAQLMRDISHPHVRLNFDPGLLLYLNEGAQTDIAASRIAADVKHVTLRDSTGQVQEWNFPALGTGGAVNFVAIGQILRSCRFAGPYAIALDPPRSEPPQPIDIYQQRVTESVQFLRSIGFFDRLPDEPPELPRSEDAKPAAKK